MKTIEQTEGRREALAATKTKSRRVNGRLRKSRRPGARFRQLEKQSRRSFLRGRSPFTVRDFLLRWPFSVSAVRVHKRPYRRVLRGRHGQKPRSQREALRE